MTRLFFLLPLLFVLGCVEKVEEKNKNGIFVQEFINIGQVRANDSPVCASFSIANHSDVSVEIEEIVPGCSCTVIELPRKTIRAGEKIDVPIKIDLFGKKGELNADIIILFKSKPLRHVRIDGTIIDDIWYEGQSIRFYVNQDQKFLSKDFNIKTVDYPDVQFGIEASDQDITLAELSRSVQHGETSILFRLTVRNAVPSRTSSRISLTAKNADLPKLTIPIFYHYLSSKPEQWLTTSHINLGEVKPAGHVKVKIFGNRSFLRDVHRIQMTSNDDIMSVISYVKPLDSDFLEVEISINGQKNSGLIHGSLALFSDDDSFATVSVSGLITSE